MYLFPVSPLPFGAALISRFDREPVALRMYGLLLVLIALTRLGVWLYATAHPHLLFELIGRRTTTLGVLVAAVPAALYMLGVLISNSAPHREPGDLRRRPHPVLHALFVDRSTAPPGSGDDEFT